MRHLLYPIERANVVQGIDAWRETSVEAEDLVFNKSGEREEVEEIGEVFPDVCIAVFPEAFVVETVDLGDLTGLVVTAEDGDALWVADFEGDEKGDGLNGEVSAVDIIT